MPSCKILDNHMCITVGGMWRPCCRFNENVQPWNERMPVDKFSFNEYRNSKFFQEVVEANKNGWHEGCKGCKIAEETGNASTRLIFNEKLSGIPNSIEYMEISLSKECNLACKMCGPWASSTWNKIVKENEDLFHGFHKLSNINFVADFEKIISEVDISNLKMIKLLGGEPFITPQTSDFFESLAKRGLLESVEIMTNTNGTFFPKKMLKYLNKTKKLSLSISLDGLNDINDYVRYKSSWQDTLSVIKKWKEFYKTRIDRTALQFSSVINAYNIHQLSEMIEFSKQQDIKLLFNIINGPTQLRLDALPIEYVEEIKPLFKNNSELESVYSYLNTMTHNKIEQDRLKQYTINTDSISNLKLKDCNPLLAKYLDIV